MGRGVQTEQSVSSDDVYEVLSNRRRRYVVHYLLQRERQVEFRQLTEQVTAWENGIPVDAVTHDQRKRVYTALRQTHLPRMDEAGVIEYDRDRGVVEPTDELTDFEIYLDIVSREDVPWSAFYLGLGILATVFTGLVLADFPPFGLLGDDQWTLLVCGTFLVSGSVHHYVDSNRRLGGSGSPPELEREP